VKSKVVGVVGGMGPAATVEFLARLVRATPAEREEEHLHILIDSDPAIPSRTEAILRGGPSPASRLCSIARGLERAGAQLLAMPCNTAHAYLAPMRAAVEIPILDMVAETAARVDAGPVGLLATEAAVRAELYGKAFASRGIRVLPLCPDDQAEVCQLIASVKSGEQLEALRPRLRRIVERLERDGARAVVIGCTEISLLHDSGSRLLAIDALDGLVEATVREARRGDR
jgi:aspartate racemase